MYYHTEIYFPEKKIWKIHKHSLAYIEAVAQTRSVKKVFSEISQNSRENTCARVSFLIKKESLAQAFSCEFCEIPKNTFFLQNTSGGCFWRKLSWRKTKFSS